MINPPSERPRIRPRLVAWILAVLLLDGCAMVGGTPAPPPSPGESGTKWTEVGVASWYGDPYHGRPTASGETYDMEAPTGAHRTLPFGTRIRVENLDNGRSATLTINDRGPFVDDRILDVSRRVARELGMLGTGTARVKITILGRPEISDHDPPARKRGPLPADVDSICLDALTCPIA